MLPYVALALMVSAVDGGYIDVKDIFIPNMYLVQAKAVSATYDRRVHCVLQIEHVYVGPESLKGERFEAWGSLSSLGLGQASEPWTSLDVKKREISIWWVTDRPMEKKTAEEGKAAAKRPRLVSAESHPTMAKHVVFSPAVKFVLNPELADDESNKDWHQKSEIIYKNVEKCAKGMERIYRADDKERLQLLKNLSHCDTYVLQRWCLDNLKRALTKADYTDYLTDLASKSSLPLWMEPFVDNELCKSSSAWRKSTTRVRFFQRWMTGKLSDGEMAGQEENFILNVLLLLNYDDFPYVTLLRLSIEGLTTDRRSDHFKNQLLEVRYFRPKDLAGVDEGFAYLISQIRESESNRRLAAARLLTHFVPLCKIQVSEVKTLLEDRAYKGIATQLTDCLEQTTLVLNGLSGPHGPKWERGEPTKPLWVRLLELAPKPQAIRFIREQVRPSLAVDAARVRQLVSDLDTDSFRLREDASRQLAALGLEAEPYLRKALARTDSTEVRRRLESLLAQFEVERTSTLRSIPILAIFTAPEARNLLEKLASGSPDSPITKEAKRALEAKEKK